VPAPILTVNQLRTYLPSPQGMVRAVDGVSFSIARGETLALVGESGSGKTIIAHSIAQLLPDNVCYGNDSQIKLGDTDLLMLPEVALRKIRGKRIGMIFQEPMTSLNPVFTVAQQIDEVLCAHTQLNRRARSARIVELLNAVGIADVKHRMFDYPHQLSGGMKQRVMIALALAGEPDLLIADEPTTALDVTIQAQVLSLLQKIQEEFSMGILLITHDLGVVAQVAHQVAVMYAGQIIEYASSEVFFAKAQHPYSQRLFESLPSIEKRQTVLDVIPGNVPSLIDPPGCCRFAARCRYVFDTCETTVPELTQTTQQKVRCHLYTKPNPLTQLPIIEKEKLSKEQGTRSFEKLLSVQDLKVYYPIRRGLFKRVVGYVKAVDGVDLALYAGQTLAIVGESGCGKTTIAKALLNLVDITQGSIERNVSAQIIFQDPFSSLDPRMNIGQIIAEGLIAKKIFKNEAACAATIAHLLQQVGLASGSAARYPHQFSGGQRQRIAIARALALSPKIIVCDEPISALDVSVQAQIINLLQQLQRELDLAYIFISHNIAAVSYLADVIAVMYLGRIVEVASAEELINNPKHPYTQGLLQSVLQIDNTNKLFPVKGELPSPSNPPEGCHFSPRCPHVMPICRKVYPAKTMLPNDHLVKCYLYQD
jgi:peptide/nickel transport system ATP-binding protein